MKITASFSQLTRISFRPAIAALGFTAVLLLTGVTQNAQALEMKDLSLYAQHQALSANSMYQWSAAYRIERPTLNLPDLYVSAVAVAPNLVIASAHGVPGPTSGSLIKEVVFGANYNTSSFRMEVASWEQFPSYVPGNASTIDLSFIWLENPIPGFNTPVTFAHANVGNLLTMSGYGDFGDPTTGSHEQLGDRLAGVAPVLDHNIFEWPLSLYAEMDFDGSSSPYALPAKGMNGDSGSPWYNAAGDLVAISTAASLGVDDFGLTVGLRLNTAEVQAELAPRIAYSWSLVPEPSVASIGLLAAGALALHRHRASTKA